MSLRRIISIMPYHLLYDGDSSKMKINFINMSGNLNNMSFGELTSYKLITGSRKICK